MISSSTKPTHITTPIGYNISNESTITVVDLRHPLYGQSFQIIGKINRPDYGLCFIVWLPEGIERHIPLAATNLAATIPPLPEIPLDLCSLQKLLTVYARLSQQFKERANHVNNDSATTTTTITRIGETTGESINAKSNYQQSHHSSTSLASIKPTPKKKNISANGKGLLRVRKTKKRSGRSSGGKK